MKKILLLILTFSFFTYGKANNDSETESCFYDVKEKALSDRTVICSDRFEGIVKNGEVKSLSNTYIRKNTFISCNIEFTAFSSFVLGRGENDYRGYYIEVGKSQINLYERGGAGYILRDTYNHNLNIKNNLTVIIDYNDAKTAFLSIYTPEGSYKQNIPWWAGGAAYIKNTGKNDFYANLNFQAKDASKPIWIIGDSYINWIYKDRWLYYIYNGGYKNWMADHIPGGNSSLMLESFKNDLLFATPVYAIWCMGMNDKSDTETVDNLWKEKITEFIKVCKAKSIIPILCTIPSVPERDHHLKAKWVRESGYRYIDFSKSVTKNDGNVWINGTLSNDGVHPTSKGALLLSNQVLIDFPEITLN